MFCSISVRGLARVICVFLCLSGIVLLSVRCSGNVLPVQNATDKTIGKSPYAAIDQHAVNTPASEEKDLCRLARYLTTTARNDIEKTRAIYRWITYHVTYDVDALFTSDIKPQSADTVLKSRSSVCSGYANLFCAMAKEAGLQVETISGRSKGLGYKPGDLCPKPNHSWNAVRIDGKWRLVDCTWGSGYAGESRNWNQDFDDHYFLTDPDEFIYDHFPEDPKWQLLPKPITLAEHEAMPYLKSTFFTCGMKLLSHRKCVIKADKSVTIELEVPETTLLLASVYKGSNALPDNLTLIKRDKAICRISAVFPKPGDYVLTIFATTKSKPEKYLEAVSYKVIVSQGTLETDYFPISISTLLFEHNGQVLAPLRYRIPAGQKAQFKLTLPGAQDVAIIDSNRKWTHLRCTDKSVFSCEAILPAGPAYLAARFSGGNNFFKILEYKAGH